MASSNIVVDHGLGGNVSVNKQQQGIAPTPVFYRPVNSHLSEPLYTIGTPSNPRPIGYGHTARFERLTYNRMLVCCNDASRDSPRNQQHLKGLNLGNLLRSIKAELGL